MSERDKRLAMNEALFRELNERVEERVPNATRDETITVLCECGNLDCTERIALPVGAYREAHEHPARFVVVPGHGEPHVEEVVARGDGYEVVRKRGLAGEIAAELQG
ncbi:MAG TPA: hypothetical protein VNJ46_04525 [Gaiellaceae bacterium]|nr:hypothetical protein [Gaiellaceae bacterium]